jgi:hypothetical protein
MMQRLSPKLAMLSPFATSYSIAFFDWYDGKILNAQLEIGITESQAPLSTVTSI